MTLKLPGLISIALLLVNSLWGQQLHSIRYASSNHGKVIRMLMQQQESKKAAMKSTSGIATERVIAQSTRDNTLVAITDSVNLKYHASGSSRYDYNDMIYAYNYPYSTSPMFNYAGMFTKPQVVFDTMKRWQVDPNTLVYGYYETDVAAYDTHYNPIGYAERYADSAINPNQLFINRFNINNDIDTGYWFNLVLGVPDSAFKQFFSYSSTHKITKDSIYEYHLGTWHLISKTMYTYDVSDNLVQIDNYANTTDTSFTLPLVEQLKYVNTYDASNRLLTVLNYTFDGTALNQYVKDTFGYSGTYTYHNAWREYQYDPINMYWAPMFNMTKTVNGFGLPDTVLIKSFDSLLNAWVPQTMDVVSYDASHNPDTLQDYEYNFTAYPPTPSFTTVYYYETYMNSLAVKPVADKGEMLVYPNPASGAIHVQMTGIQQGSVVALSLVDLSGQVVYTQYQPWQGDAVMSVENFAPGGYLLVVTDRSGNIIGKQRLIRQ